MTYDEMLNFSWITKWVHSLRYKRAEKYLKKFKSKINVIEIGCANAKFFKIFNRECDISYLGIEYDNNFYQEAKRNYRNHKNFTIIKGDASDEKLYLKEKIKNSINGGLDFVVCFETFEHMPKEKVIQTLDIIKKINPTYFLCSVPVERDLSVLIKNLISFILGYHRHKDYTINETFWAMVGRFDKLPPHDGRHKGFDWKWLSAEIKKRWKTNTESIPFKFLPKRIANSVFFICEQRIKENHGEDYGKFEKY